MFSMGIRQAALCGAFIFATAFAVNGHGQQSSPVTDQRPQLQLPAPIRPAESLEISPTPFSEQLQRAQAAVLVKCTQRRVDSGPGGNIFTYYGFNVLDTMKGAARSSFELRIFGGTLGGTTVSLPFDREFQVGGEYLLLLGPDNGAGFPTLNPAAIHVVQFSSELGRKIVVPAPGDLPLFNQKSGAALRGFTDWAFLEDVVFSLKRAVR